MSTNYSWLKNWRTWPQDFKNLKQYPVPTSCTGIEWQKYRLMILHRDFGLCQYCGDLATDIDHIIPRSQGGSNSYDNLVAACEHCNSKKGPRTPEQSGMWIRITSQRLGELNEY